MLHYEPTLFILFTCMISINVNITYQHLSPYKKNNSNKCSYNKNITTKAKITEFRKVSFFFQGLNVIVYNL